MTLIPFYSNRRSILSRAGWWTRALHQWSQIQETCNSRWSCNFETPLGCLVCWQLPDLRIEQKHEELPIPNVSNYRNRGHRLLKHCDKEALVAYRSCCYKSTRLDWVNSNWPLITVTKWGVNADRVSSYKEQSHIIWTYFNRCHVCDNILVSQISQELLPPQENYLRLQLL